MKLPLSWLNDYVDTKGIAPLELADKLVNIGFEVEEVIFTGEGIDKVYTGTITDIKPHPDADKLKICSLDCGKVGKFTIVTGASNVAKGDVVPVATNGAELPGGKKIITSPLRGVTSEGMLCGGSELGIDDIVYKGAEFDGILQLDKKTPLGEDIKKTLDLTDYIFDVSITANRPDCQSIYGLAREISTLIKRPIKPLNLAFTTCKYDKKPIDIKIENKEICSRYTGRVIKDFKIESSPDWIKKRLRLMGLKPINNAVDVTNYVLLEVGQPLHAFDINCIDTHINVRSAKENESIKLLDGNTYKLKSSMLVIADKSKALALAGVMGGNDCSINPNTTTVFLESARFSRGSVRATSRALGLRSDSSSRYEKGVDYGSIDTGSLRALSIYDSIGAGKVCDVVSKNEVPTPKEKIINTSSEQISGLLGINIEATKIAKILNDLGVKTEVNKNSIKCSVPLFREDIENFACIAEEVIRYYGYDKIKGTPLKTSCACNGGYSERDYKVNTVKTLAMGLGCNEVISYSFISDKEYDKLNIDKNDKLRKTIKIINPLNEDLSVMRTQTIGSMLDIVHTNTSRKNSSFRFFEVAKVYIPKSLPLKELPDENEVLTLAYYGENEDFYTIKNAVNVVLGKFGVDARVEYSKKSFMHPGISADIYDGKDYLGFIGKIHPSVAKKYSIPENVFVAQIELEPLFNKVIGNVKAENLPKYPSVERDLALQVKDEVLVGDLDKCIRSTAGGLCEDVVLFDVYKGEQITKGYKSIAFSIKLRDKEKTLVDAEIQKVMQDIVSALKKQFNATLRD